MRDRGGGGPTLTREVVGDARYFEDFCRVSISAAAIDVDTTSGYEPSIHSIVAFLNDA